MLAHYRRHHGHRGDKTVGFANSQSAMVSAGRRRTWSPTLMATLALEYESAKRAGRSSVGGPGTPTVRRTGVLLSGSVEHGSSTRPLPLPS